MCGICGAVGLSDTRTLESMAACLAHRGPNSTGTHLDDDVMLANQRLSIIDIEGGDQPIYNEDGDVAVVYNGEIYNFQSLRDTLRDAGHTFTTETDTEVLVHGYEEYGRDFLTKLNGMFAVALWDASAGRLLLARDRAGIKPLYYARTGDALLFGSEPKSILRSGYVEPTVDEQALQYFLQLRYSPSGTSLFAGIDTVLPGQFLDVRRDGDDLTTETGTFWTLADMDRSPPADPANAVADALERAVERQLMSDAPVGFYLSGGLDTSSIVAMAAEISDDPIHTFCMGFDDQQWDERDDARAVADYFGTNHHEFTIDQSFMRDFPEMIWHADEPKRNLYPYYVAQKMSDYVSVALGGLGADELFGGYVYRYAHLQEIQQLRSLDTDASHGVQSTAGTVAEWQLEHGDLAEDSVFEDVGLIKHLGDTSRLYVLLNSSDVIGDIDVYRQRVFGPALADDFVPADWIASRFEESPDCPLTEQALRWDFGVKMPNDFLLVEDRMSMAHSLESRVPFLDNELVDLAFSLPYSEKLGVDGADGNIGKAVLRRAMRDRLPEEVFQKDKQGFTMPTYPFVRDELLEHARAILDDPYIVRDGLIDGAYLETLLGRSPSEDLVLHYKLLWRLVALEIWYQMYVIDGAEGPREIQYYY